MRRHVPVTILPRGAWPLWQAPGTASVRISPDGRVLASAGTDGHLRLADLELGRPTFAVDLGAPIAALVLSSSLAAALVGRHVHLIHAHGGRRMERLRLAGDGAAIAVSHDGAWVAALDATGELRVFRSASGKRTTRVVGLSGTALCVDDDDAHVHVLGPAGEHAVVHVASGAVATRPAWPGGVGHVVRGSDVDGWVSLVDGDLRSGPQAEHLRRVGPWSGLDVGPKGTPIVVAGPAGVAVDGGRTSELACVDVAVHPAGQHVAVVTASGEVGLWSLDDLTPA